MEVKWRRKQRYDWKSLRCAKRGRRRSSMIWRTVRASSLIHPSRFQLGPRELKPMWKEAKRESNSDSKSSCAPSLASEGRHVRHGHSSTELSSANYPSPVYPCSLVWTPKGPKVSPPPRSRLRPRTWDPWRQYGLSHPPKTQTRHRTLPYSYLCYPSPPGRDASHPPLP